MTLPVLYHKGKGGAMYQWRVWTDGATVLTEYGRVGGELQTTVGRICTPKNEGRKNATTAEQQAELEAKSLWTNKVERKYREDPAAAEEQLFLPMLAHPIEKVKPKDLVFPAHVQPKLDGVRCIAYRENGEVRLMSRSGKPYSVPHVEKALADLLPADAVLDGELYRHGLTCQTITSLVKRLQPETEKIAYNVYDVPQVDGNDALPWHERHGALLKLIGEDGEVIKRVPTLGVGDYAGVLDRQGRFIEDGYEGAMLRLLHSPYEWGHRSRGLLKVKTFQDAEFEVVGFREGQGKMAGCVVWLCRNDLTDGTFECAPACSMEQRAEYFRTGQSYVGRRLTVKFFDRTEDQLPRFPVGKLFRDAADLGTAKED